MRPVGVARGLLAWGLLALVLLDVSRAEDPYWRPPSEADLPAPAGDTDMFGAGLLDGRTADSLSAPIAHQPLAGCPMCGQEPSACGCAPLQDDCFQPGFYIGGDFLLVRPHFSEAVAFVTVTNNISAAGFDRRVLASELDFDYEPSFRILAGYQFSPLTTLQFTYWHFQGDVSVGGVVSQPNQVFVDPFGSTVSPGGSIDTFAEVRTNVYDFDITKSFISAASRLSARVAVGARIADIDQLYFSQAFNGAGTLTNRGDFAAAFVGAGPHLAFEGRSWFGGRNQFSLLSRGSMAILIGDYDVSSGLSIPGLAAGGQQASRTRAVPVLEAEVGAAWRPTPAWTLSAGWLFQAWFNVGTSGGTFDGETLVPPVDGAFVGTDDADIMSFDGLFVRSEMRF